MTVRRMTRGQWIAAASAPLFASGSPIRAAVLGTGHAHAYAKIQILGKLQGIELAGVCEPHDEPRTHAALREVKWLTQDQVLSDKSIRMVAVESQVKYNLGLAEKCVAAGKFVHIDKAPGDDMARFRKLIDTATAKGLVVQQGYMWRYNPAMRMAVDAAAQGVLGEVRHVRAVINKVIPPTERTKLAQYRGGMMFELGCHLVDRVVDVLGKPRGVTAVLRRHGADKLEDNCLAILDYGRAIGEVYVGAHQPDGGDRRTLEIEGTNGTATVTPFANSVFTMTLKDGAGVWQPGKHRIQPPAGPQYSADFLELAAVMRGERKPSYSAQYDLDTHETLLRCCGHSM